MGIDVNVYVHESGAMKVTFEDEANGKGFEMICPPADIRSLIGTLTEAVEVAETAQAGSLGPNLN